ncbi:LLM class flavin-dependent oxidoreductase [Kutzneria sp. CA-103260]|uniref:LLM class flavin-dependent oxidoreductase n=1 Tax=Kutzneria sp. CA-103260 TaxID=2802641 RepID=UPI001BA71219|nr:LLM class flavin-dependent oxidoreductase [Kutzneria sp. CA-103260]QUQ68797.1 5,10-methylenetetrahydromethanopterin reductase [Kutzneria sp. CA-103260]
MPLTISCQFTTSNRVPEYIRIAEQLGYSRAFCCDTPTLYSEVWMQLARAAERTERIGIGPGVLVPALRHPMVNAAAISTLVSLVGQERVSVAIGSGFAGRRMLGQKPVRWADVAAYIKVLRALLAGEQAQWEGKTIQLLHDGDFGARLPIRVPLLVAVSGPKGIQVGHEIGDGVFCAPNPVGGFDVSVLALMGTVLDEGEDPSSERVLASAGPAAAMAFHFAYESGLLQYMPGTHEWAESYDEIDETTRHLQIHDKHLIGVSDRDRRFLTTQFLQEQGSVFTPKELRERLAAAEELGVTEFAYTPTSTDVPRELEAFAAAVFD